jgi:hypothetical protein
MTSKTKQSFSYWMYTAIWVLHLVMLFVSDLRDDLQAMVWYAALGLMWFHMARDERVAE